MTSLQILWAVLCVVAISAGQILFKRAGMEVQSAGTWFTWRVMLVVGIAIGIYGLATLLWIHLLRHVPLNRAYIFMALSFVLVPLASWMIYGEQLGAAQLAGTCLVVGGIVVFTVFG